MDFILRAVLSVLKFILASVGFVGVLVGALYDLLAVLVPDVAVLLKHFFVTLIDYPLGWLKVNTDLSQWTDGPIWDGLQSVIDDTAKVSSVFPLQTILALFFGAFVTVMGIRVLRWALSFVPLVNAG
jgi:hypothetical protein